MNPILRFHKPPTSKTPLRLLTLLGTIVALTGCGVNASSTTPNLSTPASLSGNWQIQTGSSITSPTFGTLVGALQIQGSQVTGTFTGTVLCSLQVHTVTGTFDPSTGNLAFNAIGLIAQLQVPADPTTTLATGSLSEGGGTCQVVGLPTPSVGVEIAPLNGTRAGAVTASGIAPLTAGNVSLAVTQSDTPNTSGQFPLTGTLTFSSGSCSVTAALTGVISGEGLTLATASGAPTSVQLTATTVPTATQVAASSIVFTPSPCSGLSSATYTGTLQ